MYGVGGQRGELKVLSIHLLIVILSQYEKKMICHFSVMSRFLDIFNFIFFTGLCTSFCDQYVLSVCHMSRKYSLLIVLHMFLFKKKDILRLIYIHSYRIGLFFYALNFIDSMQVKRFASATYIYLQSQFDNLVILKILLNLAPSWYIHSQTVPGVQLY